jgi:hypothetical protein
MTRGLGWSAVLYFPRNVSQDPGGDKCFLGGGLLRARAGAAVQASNALADTRGYHACQSVTVCVRNPDFRQPKGNAGVAVAEACFTHGNGYAKTYVDTCAHADGYAKTTIHARTTTSTNRNSGTD